MRNLLHFLLCAAFGAFAFAAHAQAPAGAPPGSTVQCNDGTFASPPKKSGACRGHKGIKVWFGPEAAASSPKPAAAASAPPARPAAAAGAAPKQAAAPAQSAKTTAAPAPGGGAGKVWVNTESKVYHCPGDRNYGTTKHGQYMSEADAKAQGARASNNKPCS